MCIDGTSTSSTGVDNTSVDWPSIILDTPSPAEAWARIFAGLLDISCNGSSPVTLHDRTVFPDRLLSEAAWQLWNDYPKQAPRTSSLLKEWCSRTSPAAGRAVLILDALSLRELPLLIGGAQARNITISGVKVTGSECPSTTDQFAHALGVPSRSSLANDGKPKTFALFNTLSNTISNALSNALSNVYTDVVSLPFEDSHVPPIPNIVLWHTWLDDLIHRQHKLPDQIAKITSSILQSDGFWNFINKLRQGRELVITSDHGYAVSKRFSSEVTDPEAVEILRQTFGASRCKPSSDEWQKRFMPPIVMTYNGQHVVMGQRKWKVQGGFPHVCHGGMSLLEAAVPYMELPAL